MRGREQHENGVVDARLGLETVPVHFFGGVKKMLYAPCNDNSLSGNSRNERLMESRSLTTFLLIVFGIFCLIDLILTKMELEAGIGYETNILSGVQYGIWFFGLLKIFEFIIIAWVAYMIDNAGKERVPIDPGAIIWAGACLAQVAGMGGTLANAGMVI